MIQQEANTNDVGREVGRNRQRPAGGESRSEAVRRGEGDSGSRGGPPVLGVRQTLSGHTGSQHGSGGNTHKFLLTASTSSVKSEETNQE